MGSTLPTIGFFLTLFGAALICYAVALQWGARWAGASNATFRRALGLLFVMAILRTVLEVACHAALSPTVSKGLAVQLGLFAIQLFVCCAIVSRGFRLTMRRAFLACLPMLAPAIVFLCLMLFVVRPYALEAYVIPSNPMAPTLMGPHTTTSCPVCQDTAVGLPTREHGPGAAQERAVICCQQFHTSWSAGPFEEADSRDRILVNNSN